MDVVVLLVLLAAPHPESGRLDYDILTGIGEGEEMDEPQRSSRMV